MTIWVLKIELNGEWEECLFSSREEAVTAFIALSADYKKIIRRAVLFPLRPDTTVLLGHGVRASNRHHLN